MAALLASIKSRKMAGSSGGVESEVSVLEAVEYFEMLQVASPSFGSVFNEAESIRCLASNMLVANYDADEPIVEAGEPGSWFGILLTGDLVVELTGAEIAVSPGTLIGEMTLWVPNSTRSATLRGKAPGGLIATMLVEELAPFCEKHPGVGAKLMTLLGRSAIGKQVDNMRRTLRQRGSATPFLELHDALSMPQGEQCARALAELLGEHSFSPAECNQIVARCQFATVAAEQVGWRAARALRCVPPCVLPCVPPSVPPCVPPCVPAHARAASRAGSAARRDAPPSPDAGCVRAMTPALGRRPRPRRSSLGPAPRGPATSLSCSAGLC